MEELSSGSESTPTKIGGTVGSPKYMSPEQAGGQLDEIGKRTDVYLLGATLYEILTGQAPHQSDSIKTMLGKTQNDEFPRPREISSNIPPALEAICLKAMATVPVDRYREASQLADDIGRWDVYQQWMLLNAMLTKTIGVRLAGSDGPSGSVAVLRAVQKFLRTDAGKREAESALIVSDRVDG